MENSGKAFITLGAPDLEAPLVEAAVPYRSNVVKVAVVTGGHQYDVMNFHELLNSLPKVDGYIQHLDDWAAASQDERDRYDVVLFYSKFIHTPTDVALPSYAGKPRTALERLGESGQGIVILHHSLLAYPKWLLWDAVVGISDRKVQSHPRQSIPVKVANACHPISKALASWDMVDESYIMKEPNAGSNTLLTVEHSKSMRSIAWTRSYRSARVFCFQPGHDNWAWSNPSFRDVLTRGLFWAAKRI